MECDSEKFKDYLSVVVTNKNMSFNRMTQNFTWAFGIFTAIIVVLIGIKNFETKGLAWYLLNLSFYFWAIFFVRSCKEYVNQIRFVGLEKRCLSFLFQTKVGDEPITNKQDMLEKMNEYHLNWFSPIRKSKVFRKVLFAHGFLALIIPIILLWVFVLVHLDKSNKWFYFALVLPLLGIYHIWTSSRKIYFKCRVEEEFMKGLE
jgi:hypothetical protein